MPRNHTYRLRACVLSCCHPLASFIAIKLHILQQSLQSTVRTSRGAGLSVLRYQQSNVYKIKIFLHKHYFGMKEKDLYMQKEQPSLY